MRRLDPKTAYKMHAVTTKFTPFFLSLIAFVMISPWTRGTIFWIDDAEAFYGFVLMLAGTIFLYEMFYALPEIGKSAYGIFGAVLLLTLSIGSYIFGGLIISNQYDVVNDTGTLNGVLSFLLGIAILMFLVQGLEEVRHYRKFSMHKFITGAT